MSNENAEFEKGQSMVGPYAPPQPELDDAERLKKIVEETSKQILPGVYPTPKHEGPYPPAGDSNGKI